MKTNRFRKQIEKAVSRYDSREVERKTRQEKICRVKDGKPLDCDLSQIDDPARIARRFMGLSADPQVGEAIIASAIASARNDRPVSVDVFERIIGQNNLVTSWFLDKGAARAKTVGRVVLRSESGAILGFGTGFLVSPQLIMTNNHVLDSEQVANTSTIQFDFVETLGGQQLTPVEFSISPDDFFETDVELDFTLVAVEPENDAGVELQSRGWNRLIAESGKAIIGERVNIIQHPGGQRQQLGLRKNEIVDVVGSFLHYSTDTERGASGSPVYNDQWQVAALHHAGVPKKDGENILLIDGTVWDGNDATVDQIAWTANEGVRISRIIEELNQRESSMPDKQREMLAEMLTSSPETESASRPAHGGASTGYSGVGEDGLARWTIPIEVSVGLGGIGEPSGRQKTKRKTNPTRPAKPKVPRRPVTDSADFALAMRKLKEHESDTYYDPAADLAANIDYYDGIDDNLVDEELFEALSQLVSSTHTNRLTYKEARLEHLYPWIDRRPPTDGQETELQSIYSGRGFSAEEAIRLDLEVATRHETQMREFLRTESFDEDAVDKFVLGLEGADPFNCEHVVPQSWFGKRQPMKSDLHHLFTCESDCNSFRSNIPYFQFGPEDEVVREHCGRREGRKFEPAAGKGAAARATMYFLLRYPKMTGDRNVELQADRLSVLLDWNDQFPVTDYERHRNAEIEKVQGNRNPFIDFPEWARFARLENGFDKSSSQ
jgi:endonuclease I/V8-like Glu-specific endopeptidase